MNKYWVGFDFDGVLVEFPGPGEPYGRDIPTMVNLLRLFIENGRQVKILSARAGNPASKAIVQDWLEYHNIDIQITDKKDFSLACIIDDLAVTSRAGELLTPLDTINTILSTLNFRLSPYA
jgi:hypothetical protein